MLKMHFLFDLVTENVIERPKQPALCRLVLYSVNCNKPIRFQSTGCNLRWLNIRFIKPTIAFYRIYKRSVFSQGE